LKLQNKRAKQSGTCMGFSFSNLITAVLKY